MKLQFKVVFELSAFLKFNTNVKLEFSNLTSSLTAALQGSEDGSFNPVITNF